MTTVSCAELLAELGSPSLLLKTVAVLVKLPSCSGRLTTMATVTDWPCSSAPPVCVQVTAASALLHENVAVLPPDGVAVMLAKLLRPAMKAGTVSLMTMPVPPAAWPTRC